MPDILSTMKTLPRIFIPLTVGVVTLLFVFLVRGPLTHYPDTKVYLGQIGYYQGTVEPDLDIQLRSFKPLYGVVGAGLSNVVTPDVAILLINLTFFFGLIIAFYTLLKEAGFSEIYAAVGASWVATGYPLLKYGLALLTDLSGWFFAAATIAVFLVGIRKNNTTILISASLVAFLGSLCKETGILGLGFAGLYLILHFAKTRNVSYLKKIIPVVLPFFLLQGLFLYILFTKSTTHTSFIQWFFFNKEGVGYELYTLYHFVLAELSTFSLLWVYAAFGGYIAWKFKKNITKDQWILATCFFVTVLPPLVWPVFLTRVLYIGYLFVIPLALVGLTYWHSKNPSKHKTFFALVALPVASSLVLFLVAGEGSLLVLFERFF